LSADQSVTAAVCHAQQQQHDQSDLSVAGHSVTVSSADHGVTAPVCQPLLSLLMSESVDTLSCESLPHCASQVTRCTSETGTNATEGKHDQLDLSADHSVTALDENVEAAVCEPQQQHDQSDLSADHSVTALDENVKAAVCEPQQQHDQSDLCFGTG